MIAAKLPDGRAGQAIMIAVAALAVLAVQAFIVSPLAEFYAGMAVALHDRWDAVERYRNAVNDLPQLRIAAGELSKETGGKPLLVEGASDELSAANLQSKLRDMVEEQGAMLISAQTLSPVAEGRFRRIGLRISFSSSLPGVTAILLGIETSHPVLSAGNFDLRSSGPGDDAILSVAMDVYGFRMQ